MTDLPLSRPQIEKLASDLQMSAASAAALEDRMNRWWSAGHRTLRLTQMGPFPGNARFLEIDLETGAWRDD